MGPSRQTWCIGEHKNRLGPSRQTLIDVVHKQAHNRFGTLQTYTGRRGALASTKTDLGPYRQTTDRPGAVASTEQIWDPPDRHR